ncbi:hydroxyacylglutathione hydrolase [Deinococcus metalli]|uniref:Hydroxyacylglutathione hydrolase n=1 Tax=Deinococcus metalli TaxID=1141878 RepID=A0A7W8KIY7_9DEIO|nr:MBL fold metallo-hydrolase [Deinococcus metalli]MBB5378628.1 hydroxyacylglutathione hydrolase [Deinococcus metalli]GHF61244.1 Zn-dependent hydrolase [Deinococcus metalli]
MYFTRFYDPDLAQASYMIGCQKTGECLVIDPIRDVTQYLDDARAQGLRITHVTETHIHADYLSGSRELAAQTSAQLLLSAEGGPGWQYTYDDGNQVKLHDGDTFMVGNVRLQVLHTPGHTPESVSFLVTDTPRGEQPSLILTGDFVFVGDLGRPDLLDEAAGGVDTRFAGARALFKSLRTKFLTLPDHVQVWPGHGAGSACGKALGAVPSTTVGYERALSWWAPLVAADDEHGFVNELLAGQPDAPLYYGRMKTENRDGPRLLGPAAPLRKLSADEVSLRVASGARLIDTRRKEDHHAAAPRGSVNLPDGKTFETWAGWLLTPGRDLILLAPAERAESLRRQLWMVGLDQVVGFIPTVEGLDAAPAQPIPVSELPQHAGALILDVRKKTEYDAGHLPGARQLHAGRLPWALNTLPRVREIVVHCQGGARSAAAASLLRAEGFHVTELAGGYDAWAHAQTALQTA